MAVHERRFTAYGGPRTPRWARAAVVTRYALREAVAERGTVAALVIAALYPLAAAVVVYLHHNAAALSILDLPLDRIWPIDRLFFLRFLRVQAVLAFLLVLRVGPPLIAVDMKDDALPLYLGRPLSRLDYLLGKAAVPLLLGSAVTWGPGLLLVALQGSLEGWSWLAGDGWVAAVALLTGSWLLLLLLVAVALAASALMRSRMAAQATYLLWFVGLAVLGQGLSAATLGWSRLLDMGEVLDAVWSAVFGVAGGEIPPGLGLLVVAVVYGGCVVLLAARVHPVEVSR